MSSQIVFNGIDDVFKTRLQAVTAVKAQAVGAQAQIEKVVTTDKLLAELESDEQSAQVAAK
jgi:hypothetical protein